MKKSSYIIVGLAFFSFGTMAQSTIDSVLTSIAENNKDILANVQYWEARNLELTTGLTPANPKIDYDYLIGTPANAGNQTDFVVTQALDFPTAYIKKKQLSNEQIKLAEFQLVSTRQDILLSAKLICVELVYRNKLQAELQKRKRATEKWLDAFETSLEKGEGNVLDVNKAKLQLIEINAVFQENVSAINQLNQKLTELNGGVDIELADTSYAPLPSMLDFEELETEIEQNDPVRNYLKQEKLVGQKEVELGRAMALPKIEAGYHYQAILGQRFNGVHLGLTVPLWENKNKVKAHKANLVYNEFALQSHLNEHYYDIKQNYEKQGNLKAILSEYESLFDSLNNIEILDKSLAFGEITTLEYFLEMKYYYDALRNYLRTEKEYHQAIAELYKYRL